MKNKKVFRLKPNIYVTCNPSAEADGNEKIQSQNVL